MAQTLLSEERKKDISELRERIDLVNNGQIDQEKFRLYRLTRGVYGQRQPGVQMVRIKLPYGRVTAEQLRTIADLSAKYANGNLHITTRQNIQLHYVPLEDSPAIWESLEQVGVTTLESCGNTVRGITASALAGIDPNEPFDVSPYAHAVFEYFLKNPICGDMGRKIKIAFSSSEQDSAFTYIHDFGFIPRIVDGVRGFRVLIGGGLGAQAFMGQVAFDFLPTDEIIPFVAAGLRVFDRFGERERRHKARLKFLVDPKKGIGVDGFLKLVEEERKSLPDQVFEIHGASVEPSLPAFNQRERAKVGDLRAYQLWRETNVSSQKQDGFYVVKVRVPQGNIDHETALSIAQIIEKYCADDLRFSVNQGFLLKYVREENLPNVYSELDQLGLTRRGFDTLADITACPGTDTCNLGVTNSTALSSELENVIVNEFAHLIDERLIKIKISGCMNSCGQHMVANIGFSGSSIKHEGKVAPAMQVVIGGGVDPDGQGFIAEKVIKLPTKQIPDALRLLLEDFETNAEDGEYFNQYFRRVGKIYLYDLLKHLGDFSQLGEEVFQDWGRVETFKPEIGVGECAGVSLDLVSTILADALERHENSKLAIKEEKWANAIYYAYNSMIIGAKAILLSEDIRCNTHKGIIDDFDTHIVAKGLITLDESFSDQVLLINKEAPNAQFALHYLDLAEKVLAKILAFRNGSTDAANPKEVINNYYNA